PAGPVDAHRPMSSASSARSSSAGAYRTRPAPAANRVAGGRPVAAGMARAGVRPGSRTTPAAASAASSQQVQELNRQIIEAKVLIDTAEKERDFYFTKLREIEVYLQSTQFEAGTELDAMAKHIQNILYSTEEGDVDDLAAEHMDDLNAEHYGDVSGHMGALHVDEEETF
ncbi:microtubule integrity protein mal3, partial [Kickxella alabastrina]